MKSDLDRLKKALLRIEPILSGYTIEETSNSLGVSITSIENALRFVLNNIELLPQVKPDIDLERFVSKISEILRKTKLKEAYRRIKPILEGMTIEETAQFLNLSSSSVDKALKYVRDNASQLPEIEPSINPEEFVDELNDILKTNTTKGRKNASHSGGRTMTWTDETAIEIAHLFLANGLTLRKAAPILGYPKATILEMLNSEAVRSNVELYNDIRTMLQINTVMKIKNINNSIELTPFSIEKEELGIKYQAICKEKGYDGSVR